MSSGLTNNVSYMRDLGLEWLKHVRLLGKESAHRACLAESCIHINFKGRGLAHLVEQGLKRLPSCGLVSGSLVDITKQDQDLGLQGRLSMMWIKRVSGGTDPPMVGFQQACRILDKSWQLLLSQPP